MKPFFNKRTLLLLLLIHFVQLPKIWAQTDYPFQNPELGMEERVDNIISLLTTEEKIDVITNFEVPRLNIPSPGSSEGIHQAVVRTWRPGSKVIPTTSFSQVYGMGETWDPDLVKKAASTAAYEARYISQNEKYDNDMLVLWGPTSNMARDPRWGRTDESFGEDPFLTGTMVVSYIKGLQGDDPKYWKVASLLKHLFANSNETTRGRSSSNFDERLMREYYSVSFRRGFTEGGAKSYMAAYNAWNGVPMTVNPVLKEVARKEWGAGWIISSDAGAISKVVDGHKYMDSMEEAYAALIKLGMNQLLAFGQNSKEMIQKILDENRITEEDLDSAIRGKLKTIIKLGLLDPPEMVPYSKIGASDEPEPWNTEKHKAVARQVAKESVVLLKNENDLLPLDEKSLNSVAVVGPRAGKVLLDFYSSETPYSISVLDGITKRAGKDITINYAENNEYGAAVDAAKKSDVAIVVVGNDPFCGTTNIIEAFNPDLSTKPCPEAGDGREGRDRQTIDLPSEDLVKEVFAANPNTIVVLISSFPYSINWSQENVPSILHITHAAQEQGTAIAEVLFGDYNPAGRLVQTWPKSLAQLPYMMDYNIRHGRTYMYFNGQPLYPFGYGLSYSTFNYSNLKVSSDQMDKKGEVKISVDIKNSSTVSGEEVVQLYVQYPESKVKRAQKELKGFERIPVQAGDTQTVDFTLKAEDLAWWNEETGSFEVEEGPVNLLIGSSSADIRLTSRIEVE